MFHGWLKSRFFSKCKSDLKLTKTRIEMIKKKRNAIQKYLRKDVADLLRHGLDYNAFHRAAGLIVEMNRTHCYDLIDQYCELVSTHLASLDKQRECPEECREAVSSLMFAAARFADLPELRQLRTLFSERFGKSLDSFVSKEFAEKSKSRQPSKDVKLQLLQEVAAESGIEWDSKALENKLYNESIAHTENLAKDSDDMEHGSQPCREREVPIFKDILVDSIGRFTNGGKKEEFEDKPIKYNSIPPPYKISEAEDKVHRHADGSPQKATPAGKSVRTRGHKPQPDHASTSDSDGDKKEAKNKESAAALQGQRIMRFFDKGGTDQRSDEDEKTLDKLLDYYSRRGSTGRNRDDGPGRSSSSLTADPIAQSENPAKHVRSASCQPGLSDGDKGHVHPRLPDYDEFMARLATLRQDMR